MEKRKEQLENSDDSSANNSKDPSMNLYNLTTAQTLTIFPGFVGLHIEGQRYDPLGHQIISTVGFSPHLLSHIDLPSGPWKRLNNIPKKEPDSKFLQRIAKYEPLEFECILIDLAPIADKARAFAARHPWPYERKDTISSLGVSHERVKLPELLDPKVDPEDLSQLYTELQMDLPKKLQGQSIKDCFVIVNTNRQRFTPSYREIASSFWGGWHISWLYPYLTVQDVKWLAEQGAVGIGTDAYSVDSFCHTVKGGSYSPSVRELMSRCAAEQDEACPESLVGGPAHWALFDKRILILECLKIPRELFVSDTDRTTGILDRLRQKEQTTEKSPREAVNITRGSVLIMPHFVVHEMGAVVVAVHMKLIK